MFLHLSVILFMGEGGVHPPCDRHPLEETPWQTSSWSVAPSWQTAPLPPGRHTLGNHSPADIPPEMATAADGTHPTGMHSCLKFSQNFLSKAWLKMFLIDKHHRTFYGSVRSECSSCRIFPWWIRLYRQYEGKTKLTSCPSVPCNGLWHSSLKLTFLTLLAFMGIWVVVVFANEV